MKREGDCRSTKIVLSEGSAEKKEVLFREV